jgi:hypothetical protein
MSRPVTFAIVSPERKGRGGEFHQPISKCVGLHGINRFWPGASEAVKGRAVIVMGWGKVGNIGLRFVGRMTAGCGICGW